MDMMMHTAEKQKERQFIFLSPLDMRYEDQCISDKSFRAKVINIHSFHVLVLSGCLYQS